MSSAEGVLTIRAATSPGCLKPALALAKEELWPMAKNDDELYYAADPNGFYTGYFGNERVSYVSMMTHGDSEYCFIGMFLVYPEHRKQGKGYGAKTWELAWSRIPRSVNCIALSSTEDMAAKYTEKYNFEPTWKDYTFHFDAKDIISLPHESEVLDVVPCSDVNFGQLLEYDVSVFGYTRVSFLRKLVNISEGWVARNSHKEIVGYCAIRECIIDDCGWNLGPWYANDFTTAKSLLNTAAKFAENCSNIASVLSCYIPEINEEAMRLAKSISTPGKGYPRMFCRSKPEVIVKNCKERVFAISSFG